MKTVLTLLLCLLFSNLFSQTNFPSFLAGTWKSEDGKTFEHWDVLSPTLMKGYSYEMNGNETVVKEYLEIGKVGKSVVYTPTVIGQNDGKPVQFKMTKSDSVFVFENPKHDFPKKIIYTKLSEHTINVEVLGSDNQGFSYHMVNQNTIEMLKSMDQIFGGTDNPNYDAALAKKVGSDDYGMKSYVFVILKTGTNTTTDKKYIDSCFTGHMSNMGKLVDANQLVVAGPFQKNDKTYRGLFILNVTTTDEAKKILATDPAVNAGLLAYEVYGWYGSAALSEYLEASEKIWKKKF